jgi:hypothetical protein
MRLGHLVQLVVAGNPLQGPVEMRLRPGKAAGVRHHLPLGKGGGEIKGFQEYQFSVFSKTSTWGRGTVRCPSL